MREEQRRAWVEALVRTHDGLELVEMYCRSLRAAQNVATWEEAVVRIHILRVWAEAVAEKCVGVDVGEG